MTGPMGGWTKNWQFPFTEMGEMEGLQWECGIQEFALGCANRL